MGGGPSREALLATSQALSVREIISSNCVVIFSKSTCSYCRQAKDVFRQMSVSPKVIELNQREDGSEIQNILSVMTGGTTVPRVFVNGECIGGGTETKALYKSGKLDSLVQQCSS